MDPSDPPVSTEIIVHKLNQLSPEELVEVEKWVGKFLDGKLSAPASPSKRSSKNTNVTQEVHLSAEQKAVEELKRLLTPFVSSLKNAKDKGDDYLWWFPVLSRPGQYNEKKRDGEKKTDIASLASHLGKSDDDFVQLLKDAKLFGRYGSWRSKLSVSVCTYGEGSNTTWIVLDEEDNGKKFGHYPKQQIDGEETRPDWTGDPKEGFIEGVTNDERLRAARERRIADDFVSSIDHMMIKGCLDKILVKARHSRRGIKNGLKPHVISGRKFWLPIHYEPIHERKKEEMETNLNDMTETAARYKLEAETLRDWRMKNESNAALGEAVSHIDTIREYPSTAGSRRLYSLTMAEAPKLAVGKLSQISPLIVSAALHDLGLADKLVLVNVPKCTPSESTLRNIVREGREVALVRIAKMLKNRTPFALAHDKGERGGLGRLVKVVACWNFKEDRVDDVRYNSDGSKGRDGEVAQALDLSLSEVDDYLPPGERARFCAHTTDGGGGGTGHSEVEELRQLDRVDPFVCYTLICCLHAQSKCLSNGINRNYGDGGLGKRDFLQLLHTCWSLQEALGERFKSVWLEVNPTRPAAHAAEVQANPVQAGEPQRIEMDDEDWGNIGRDNSGGGNDQQRVNNSNDARETAEEEDVGTMQKPVDSRWWAINIAGQQVNERTNEWQKLFQHCYEMSSKEERQKVHTISKNGLALIKSKKIRCDLLFFCLFSKHYWAPHTKWMHRNDENTKRPAYSAHNLPARAFIMKEDLDHDAENWETSPKYHPFVEAANALPDDAPKKPGKQTTLKQARAFFATYQNTFKKYYTSYWTELLPFAIAGGSPRCATVFANWYLGNPPPIYSDEYSLFDCSIHGRKIDIRKWRAFLDKYCGNPTDLEDPILSKHVGAIRSIAFGAPLYDDADTFFNDDVAALQIDCKKYMLPAKHQTQPVEGGVREISMCSATGRSEEDASALSTIRSLDCHAVNEQLNEAYDARPKKGNRHRAGGVGSDREPRSKAAARLHRAGQNTSPPIQYTKGRASGLIAHSEAQAISPEDINRAKAGARKRKLPSSTTAKKLRMQQSAKRDEEMKESILLKAQSNRLPADIEAADADVPAVILDLTKLTTLQRTKHIDLVRDELGVRYEPYDNTMRIKELVGLLKKFADKDYPDHIKLVTANAEDIINDD